MTCTPRLCAAHVSDFAVRGRSIHITNDNVEPIELDFEVLTVKSTSGTCIFFSAVVAQRPIVDILKITAADSGADLTFRLLKLRRHSRSMSAISAFRLSDCRLKVASCRGIQSIECRSERARISHRKPESTTGRAEVAGVNVFRVHGTSNSATMGAWGEPGSFRT